MTEEATIARTKSPVSVDSLFAQLRLLGVAEGDLLLVHSSLSALGWVNGGPVAVIQALAQAVGLSGTIVMPAQSSSLTDPENWGAPPVPTEWLETIRDTMPAYDPAITPTRNMGQIAELFRTWPGTIRSAHPSSSFAALGPSAYELMREHDLTNPLGDSSPLGALYRHGAKILLIGVDFDTCTALHLAEQKVWPNRAKVKEGAPLMVGGERRWVSFEVPKLLDSDAFIPVGASALRSGIGTVGALGEGRGIFVDMRKLVDHAVGLWSSKPHDAATLFDGTKP
ncbi:MAG: AAC(3) family N-acetyltransferase [Pseudomonadota bacterium]